MYISNSCFTTSGHRQQTKVLCTTTTNEPPILEDRSKSVAILPECLESWFWYDVWKQETLNARSEYSNSEEDGIGEHRINQYLLGQEIGRGSFGSVHIAVDQFGQEFVRRYYWLARVLIYTRGDWHCGCIWIGCEGILKVKITKTRTVKFITKVQSCKRCTCRTCWTNKWFGSPDTAKSPRQFEPSYTSSYARRETD